MTPLPHRAACRAGMGLALVAAATSCSRPQTVPADNATPMLRIPAPATRSADADIRVRPVEWSAGPWSPGVAPRDWNYIVIHHTATSTGSVESIHQTHLMRRDAEGNPWRGIGYHFVIGNGHGMPDGEVRPTFRWQDQIEGAHAGDATYNARGIGVCLVGNFEQDPPTAAQLEALKDLTQSLSSAYEIPPQNIIGHGDVRSTACPGRYFPMQELTQILSGQAKSFTTESVVP